MYKSETTVRVRYGETDKMGVVYHANFIPYFELGRTDALRSMGLSYRQFEASGIIMPVIEVGIKYHKPAYYDDELIIITITLFMWILNFGFPAIIGSYFVLNFSFSNQK